MEKYISKSALVAEIERRKNENFLKSSENISSFAQYEEDVAILSIIDEVQKENLSEDLEEELDEWIKYGPHTNYPWCTIPDAIKITAEHFFELGLKAQKGE